MFTCHLLLLQITTATPCRIPIDRHPVVLHVLNTSSFLCHSCLLEIAEWTGVPRCHEWQMIFQTAEVSAVEWSKTIWREPGHLDPRQNPWAVILKRYPLEPLEGEETEDSDKIEGEDVDLKDLRLLHWHGFLARQHSKHDGDTESVWSRVGLRSAPKRYPNQTKFRVKKKDICQQGGLCKHT